MRYDANRGLKLCNAKHPRQRKHWCTQNFTPAMQLGTLQLNAHKSALWNDRSHAKESAVGAICSPDTTPLNTQRATLQSLARRLAGMHTGRCNAGHNAAASHWSPSFIMGAVLSKVMSHQRFERPNGVSHHPRTPTRFATRICNKTGHSDVTNAHRVMHHRRCASPMRDCIPNIAQRASCTIRSRRPSKIIASTGLELSSVLLWMQYTLLCAAIRTLEPKSANCCWRAQRTNSEGSTNCMPSPPL